MALRVWAAVRHAMTAREPKKTEASKDTINAATNAAFSFALAMSTVIKVAAKVMAAPRERLNIPLSKVL